MRRWSVVLCVALASPIALAQEETAPAPIARTRLEPGPMVTVGQPIDVIIEVLVPSFFSGAPQYPDLDIGDAVTLFNPRGSNFSERIDGETWAGQSRSYTIYPQRAGEYTIAAIPVDVVYFEGGRVTATASPPPVTFEARLPAGAEALPYFIATGSLSIEEAFDTKPETMEVGDAFTRRITVTVQDALSMVIPPILVQPIDGLGVYADPATVNDGGGVRGEAIVGTRVESHIYVAEAEGDYRLPAVELVWWDVGADQARTAALPELEFRVVAATNPESEIPLPPLLDEKLESDETDSGRSRVNLGLVVRRYGPPAAAVLILLVACIRLARRFRPRILAWDRIRRQRVAESEATYFRKFHKAARSGDPKATARALMFWLDRFHKTPGAATFRRFAGVASDPDLDREAQELDRALYSRDDGANWTGRRLRAKVAKARKRLGRSAEPTHRGADTGALKPLNPTRSTTRQN